MRSLFVIGITSVLLIGCIEPNPGLTFTAKSPKSEDAVSILEAVQNRENLHHRTNKSIERFGPLVQQYAHAYQVDWRLVLAVMRQESSFRPGAVSHKGAYGLMQIMPLTEAELSRKIGLKNAKSPKNNIRAGIYHLKSLYRQLESARGDERIRLTLAAYNAGLNRIRDAQDIAAYMGDDPNTWKGVKDALPLLSRRYYSLHSRIWDSGVPRSGYLHDVRQTTNYVENIMEFYGSYQLALR